MTKRRWRERVMYKYHYQRQNIRTLAMTGYVYQALPWRGVWPDTRQNRGVLQP